VFDVFSFNHERPSLRLPPIAEESWFHRHDALSLRALRERGITLELQLSLSATVGTNGQVKVSGDLVINSLTRSNGGLAQPWGQPAKYAARQAWR